MAAPITPPAMAPGWFWLLDSGLTEAVAAISVAEVFDAEVVGNVDVSRWLEEWSCDELLLDMFDIDMLMLAALDVLDALDVLEMVCI